MNPFSDIDITEVLYGDDEHFDIIVDSEMVSKSRWSIQYETIVKCKINDKFYRIEFTLGSTEYQDNGVEDIQIFEVEPVEVHVIQYQNVNKIRM